jgi:GDP-L-fucose synthase
VIPTNIYGPNDNFNLDDAHVIPALIHKCYLAKKNNDKKFVVCGSGKPLRQFIYSMDLARLLVWTLESYDETEPIILSPSFEISIRDVAILIAKKFEYDADAIVFDENYADGQYKKTVDNSKILKMHGDYEFTHIEDGLRETVDWFIENYNVCRK